MHRKKVLYVQEGLGLPERFAAAVDQIDADLAACAALELRAKLSTCDVVVYSVDTSRVDAMEDFEKLLVQADNKAALLAVDDDALRPLRLPAHIPCDFVLPHAGADEIALRLRHLLWPGEEAATAEFISVDSMTINLATYQVQVAGEPVDFTYLEYALLAFLVTHPGHAYPRDVLLSRVWGFDYYGGSRTVDVHVRRIRAKLGSELSAHLETVRGVGYMWSN